MDEYVLVELNAKGLAKSYDALRKLVPLEYKNRKFVDLVDFMVQPGEDEHGNTALMDLEKELAREVKRLLRRDSSDANFQVGIDIYKDGEKYNRTFSPHDRVGGDEGVFVNRTEVGSDGSPLEYQSLDCVVQGYDAGGSK